MQSGRSDSYATLSSTLCTYDTGRLETGMWTVSWKTARRKHAYRTLWQARASFTRGYSLSRERHLFLFIFTTVAAGLHRTLESPAMTGYSAHTNITPMWPTHEGHPAPIILSKHFACHLSKPVKNNRRPSNTATCNASSSLL